MRNKFIPIIKTKLSPPRIGLPNLTRPRLLERLEKHFRQPLTFLMGPAGYGKTTLMTQWLEKLRADGFNTAWLSLDERDNVPDQFLSYLCSAFKILEPSMSVQIEEFDDLGSARVPEYVVAELVNSLSEKEQKYVLFLDDYHEINQDQIHNTIQYLISNLPPNLNIYIGTRGVPPFSLSRLKVADQVHLLGSESLRFDTEEAGQFLSERTSIALEPKEIDLLLKRTEGWPAALQLAVPSLARIEEREAFIDSFSGDHHSITDFLAEEVLNRLPEHVLNILLRLSVVDRFNVSLCSALTDQNDVRDILENPQSDAFLLQRFEGEDSWYRLHPLVRGYLRDRLEKGSATEVVALHEKAAQWFEQHGLITEALQHLLDINKKEHAFELIEKTALDMIEQGHLALLISLVHKLPQGQVASCEKILVPLAWAQLLSQQHRELQGLLEQIETLIAHADAEQRNNIELEISVIRAAIQAFSDDITACHSTIEQWPSELPEGDYFTKATMGNIREFVSITNYQFDEVYALQKRSQALFDKLKNPGTKVWGRLFSMLALLQQLRIFEAKDMCAETLDICRHSRGNGATFRKMALLVQGAIYYYEGETERAFALFESGYEVLKGYGITEMVINILPLIVRSYQLKNNRNKAQAVLSQVAFIAHDRGLNRLHSCVLHEQIRGLLRENELIAARQLFENALENRPVGEELSVVEEQTCEWFSIAEARLSISAGELQQADEILKSLQQGFKSQGRNLRLLEIYLLQAQLAYKIGDKDAALSILTTAMQLTGSEQCIQPFIDEGSDLVPLYQTLAIEASDSSMGEKCYTIIERLNSLNVPLKTDSSQLSHNDGGKQLADPLSKRELQVLQLVAQGLSNRDIADQLYLSIDTIKTHLKSIFSKMAVARRTQAVSLGRELKLIE